ncbi:MAG: hypothetical protein IJ941_02915, partial [Clostridia bacterium]|nr:hypothetical protein [Clostridia bacterium]
MLSIYMDNEKQVHDFDAMYNTKVLYRMPNYEDADSPYSREYAEGMVTSQVINRLSSCSEELLNNVPTDMASNTLYDDVKKLTDTMGLFLKGVSYAEKHQRLHCNVQMVEQPCSYELGRVYSAVMFALIPELYDITIGNWSYYEYHGTIYKRTDTVPPESSVGEVIAREDIAAYYAELIMKPLEEYGTSGSGIRELLSAIAKVRGVNGALSGITDVDGDGLEDTITVDTDNTADENFTPETAKATLTVKLGRGETITQEIPGWWQNAEYHTADFDADNRTDIALMLWVGGSNYDATNVYVYHMGNSKLTELAKNVITNDAITYDQSKYSALNGENTHWVSGGTVISEGGKSKLRLRQLLDYDPGAGISTAYYTNLVWNGSGWFIESMEIGEAFGEEQVQPDTLQYAPMLPDPIDTLSDMDLLIYSSLTNNSKVYALPRTLSGNDLSTSIWDNIIVRVNNRYFQDMPYDAAGAAYNVVQVRYNDDGTIDVYLILTYRRYTLLNDELSVDGELNCAVIWQYKENENGEIEFSNMYWPIKDSKGRVSYGNREWPEDLQKYAEFSPDSIGRAERLQAIDEQIAISMDNNEKVDALLSTIVSSPKGSSARIDYIHEHVGEYGQLCAMGRRAVSRFMPRFESGRETGLEGQIMAAVLNALTGVDSLGNYKNGQEWYDASRNGILAYMRTAVQPTPALNATSPEWQNAERVCAPFSETGKRIDLSYYEVSIDLNGTERTSTMTENNVTPDQFDRTDEGQTLLFVYRASADAINDSSRMEDLFLQFARISRFETVTEFIQLDHTAYFGADSPVYRLEKMTSVMDIAEPGWDDTAYTTYFAYLTPQ